MKLEDEIGRVRDGLIFKDPKLPPPDGHCERLLERGERTAAIRYCKEMWSEYHRAGEQQRAEAYLAYIDQLQNEQAEPDPKVGI